MKNLIFLFVLSLVAFSCSQEETTDLDLEKQDISESGVLNKDQLTSRASVNLTGASGLRVGDNNWLGASGPNFNFAVHYNPDHFNQNKRRFIIDKPNGDRIIGDLYTDIAFTDFFSVNWGRHVDIFCSLFGDVTSVNGVSTSYPIAIELAIATDGTELTIWNENGNGFDGGDVLSGRITINYN